VTDWNWPQLEQLSAVLPLACGSFSCNSHGGLSAGEEEKKKSGHQFINHLARAKQEVEVEVEQRKENLGREH